MDSAWDVNRPPFKYGGSMKDTKNQPRRFPIKKTLEKAIPLVLKK